jgi:hypothetical protein
VTGEAGGGREWIRGALLLALAVLLAPLGPQAVVVLPLALVLAFLADGRGMLLLLLSLFLAWGGGPVTPLWHLERGWGVLAGGCFVAISLRWPEASLISRGVGSVAAGLASAALLLVGMPGGWSIAEWAVRERMEAGGAATADLLRVMGGDSGPLPGSEELLVRAVEAQVLLLPALLGLATLAALSFAWWVLVRVARGRGDGVGPLRSFRFPDGLVWVLIGGLVLLVVGGEGWFRVGVNAVAFMAGLYALRGAGVVVGVQGGFSLFGWFLFGIGVLFAAPAVLAGTFLVGLGDTWLDLRARAEKAAG